MYKAGKARRAFFAVAVGCCALTFTVLGQTAGCIAGQHEDAEGVCVVCEPDTYSTTIGATECKPHRSVAVQTHAAPLQRLGMQLLWRVGGGQTPTRGPTVPPSFPSSS